MRDVGAAMRDDESCDRMKRRRRSDSGDLRRFQRQFSVLYRPKTRRPKRVPCHSPLSLPFEPRTAWDKRL